MSEVSLTSRDDCRMSAPGLFIAEYFCPAQNEAIPLTTFLILIPTNGKVSYLVLSSVWSLIIETINTFERPDKIYARKILRNLESVCKLFGKQSGGYHKRSIASFYVSIPWKSDLKVNITSGILKQDLVLQVFQSPWNSCDPPVVYWQCTVKSNFVKWPDWQGLSARLVVNKTPCSEIKKKFPKSCLRHHFSSSRRLQNKI